jgi:pimeloyl-ACP methyl ester carboxylesterase
MRWTIEHGMTVRRIGSGPELVWIHGLGEASTCFEALPPKLPGWTHVLPDLPGYGRSVWPERALGLDELGGLLAGWLAERPPAIVVGHSMGGVLALLLAERNAARGIVNVEGNLSPGDCTFSSRIAAYSPEAFAAGGVREIRDWVWELGRSDRPIRGYHAAMAFASPDVLHRHSRDLVEMSAPENMAARLARPTLYIAGVPSGICERSRTLLDQHRVPTVALEPAGHWPYVDQTARFCAAVTAFTASCGSG